jgi:hypothetical protein
VLRDRDRSVGNGRDLPPPIRSSCGTSLSMKKSMKLKTRHPKEFRLCGESGALDPRRFDYAHIFGVNVYREKRRILADYLGTDDQFLWCIDGAEQFPDYEAQKPMEWLLEIGPERVVGYVNNDEWSWFLQNRRIAPEDFASRPEQGNPSWHRWVSVLVAYPLHQQEVLGWALYTTENKIVRQGNLEDL